jgi:hypothetical protein
MFLAELEHLEIIPFGDNNKLDILKISREFQFPCLQNLRVSVDSLDTDVSNKCTEHFALKRVKKLLKFVQNKSSLIGQFFFISTLSVPLYPLSACVAG